MIYILDDTISQRKPSIRFLWDGNYSDTCKIIEYPTVKDIREILTSITGFDNSLICIHKSLKIYTEERLALNNSDILRNNFITQIKQITCNKCDCVIFSGDISTIRDNLYINKDLFYRNLKLFLDNWKKGNYEIRILFDGPMYKYADRKRLLDIIITITNTEDFPYENTTLRSALKDFFTEKQPEEVISYWKKKEMSKKEIRQYINELL